MTYLTCPRCGLTIFDRNPLASPRNCPRCARRQALAVELERVPKMHGGAAASVLVRRQAVEESVQGAD
jgi:ribosomal protein S27AE